MHFTQATSAILATLAFSSTALAGILKTADEFCSGAAGCTWQTPASWPGVLECSCNLAPSDGKSVLLLQGYTDEDYEGFVYNGWSTPGVCNNMPGLFDRNTESMNINPDNTSGCWLYTVPDCPKNAPYAVIDKNNIAQMQGIYKKGVRSYICDPK
ncbi:hypothetical protein NHQ30_005616 [Ciborinia camelliae]|nr:hypothetical protein NHQ30_005616 [Ciborinia camelliae]